MRTIAHISDLHFGRENLAVQHALLDELKALEPSMVVISGDLTQRAHHSQFEQARSYLQAIPFPLFVVPGNHDIASVNLARRFFFPLTRYRFYISEDVNPVYLDDEIAMVGFNTARSLALHNGRISKKQLTHMCKAFEQAHPNACRLVVSHHAFLSPEPMRRIVGGATNALQQMDNCGVELVMAGHLHLGHVADVRTAYSIVEKQIIAVQSGTTISNRLKGEPNTFNVISIDDHSITVGIRAWNGAHFEEIKSHAYVRRPHLASHQTAQPEAEKQLVKVRKYKK